MSYEYVVKGEGETEKRESEADLILYWGSVEAFVDFYRANFEGQLPTQIVNDFAEQGFTVSVVGTPSCEVWVTYEPKTIFDRWVVLHSKYTATVLSDKSWGGSPLLAEIVFVLDHLLIKIAIAIAIIIAVIKFAEWVQSMTTTTTIVKTHEPDCTWTEETVIAPSPMGIAEVLTFGIIAIVVIYGASLVLPRVLAKE